ncbi:c-type cytochrome [Dongia soli]|uniref:Cytochrome c n=1 Tax=Dongia soli TaxID=600628 RepID=A0ABU5EAY7_9PROT|nr:cytochrome c [Dongia soli]MDY0883442.1 cytochrome c [Dongia soli]
MLHRMLLTALVAGIVLAPFYAKAEDKLALKSVNVNLPDDDSMFPDRPGADAANNNCLACHSASMVLNQPALSKAQWQAEVNKMRMTYKAPVDAKDVDAIVAYLVTIKGAK